METASAYTFMLPEDTVTTSGQLPLTLDASAAGLTYTWAKGLTFDADGSVSSGYYDVNKNWQGDSLLCWAAAASNLIAWWQAYYGTTAISSSDVPTDVDDIFDTFKANWENIGGWTPNACIWWLAGESNDSSYNTFYSESYIGNGSDGGYYSQVYNAGNIGVTVASNSVGTFSATATATGIANCLDMGGMVQLSINKYNGSSFYNGHAITLWGVTVDDSTGYLTSIHITDSDDNQSALCTVDVYYDAASGYYRLTGSRKDYYLLYYNTLGAYSPDGQPTYGSVAGLQVQVSGTEAQFTWTGPASERKLLYEIAYRLPGDTTYHSWTTQDTHFTLSLPRLGSYRWAVRVKDGAGYVSDWVFGSNFACAAPLEVTLADIVPQKSSEGQSTVSFAWTSSNKASFTLSFRTNTFKCSGTSGSFSFGVPDGTHTYTLTAVDEYGNTVTLTGQVVCDATAPEPPDNLQLNRQGNQATLSWGAVEDVSGVSYELRLLLPGSSSYSYQTLSGTSYTWNLPGTGTYEWAVRAVDGRGNATAWVVGESCIVPGTPPEVSLNAVTQDVVDAGQTLVYLSWTGDAGNSYTLRVGDTVYHVGTATSYSLTLADGQYDITLTATNAGGLSTTRTSTVLCDASAPSLPASLQVQQQGDDYVLSWNPSADAHSVRYEIRYRAEGDSDDTCVTVDGASFTFTPNTFGTYTWAVRAVDSHGNTTSWVSGDNFHVAEAAPELAPPSRLVADQPGDYVSLRWLRASDKNATKIEIRYRRVGSDTYSYLTCHAEYLSRTLKLEAGTYEWAARSRNDAGQYSAWVEGGTFSAGASYSFSPGLSTPDVTKLSTGLGRVCLTWGCEADATFTVEINGKTYNMGSQRSLVLDMEDGYHCYKVTATSSSGVTSTRSLYFYCDTTPPTAPLNPSVTVLLSEQRAVISWGASQDLTGCGYEIIIDIPNADYQCQISTGGAGPFSYDLPGEGVYHWRIRARDSYGNCTDWVECQPFVYSLAPLTLPQELSSAQQGQQIIFSWKAPEQGAGVTYELRYKLQGESDYRYATVTGTSFSLTLDAEGVYEWSVRALREGLDATDWIDGAPSAADLTPPVLALSTPQQARNAEGKTSVTFTWTSSEAARYTLSVDGVTVYEGSEPGTSLTLADGEHHYRLTATDAAGNSSVQEGSLLTDASAPTLPAGLTCILLDEGRRVTLSWNGSSDTSGLSYTLALKAADDSDYTYYQGLTQTSITRQLDKTSVYSWGVCAVDGKGNSTGWVWGKSFNNDLTPPVLALSTPQQARNAEGKTSVTFSWTSSEAARYTLTVDGKKRYEGNSARVVLTLADGSHSYSVKATDAAGNSSEKKGSLRTDASAPTRPSGLSYSLSQRGALATFRWKAAKDASALTYTLAIKASADKAYTLYSGLAGTSSTLRLSKSSVYSWGVRAVDSKGNSTGWVWGKSFNNDLTPPVLTFATPQQARRSTGKTRVTFAWMSSESASYTLTVDGKKRYVGRKSRVVLTLADGSHSYSVKATDAAGNSSVKKGSLRTDASAPTRPSGLTCSLSQRGARATFCWKAARDASAVTYTLAIKASGDKTYTCYSGLTATSIRLQLSKTAVYSWRVRAVDSRGNSTSWVRGKSFNNDLTPPVLTLTTPQQARGSSGKTKVTFDWASSESASYTLTVDGKKRYVGRKSRVVLTLADGWHSYSVKATDAAGNSSVKKGSLRTDASAPTRPSGLTYSLSQRGAQVAFRWKAARDASAVTYTLAIKASGDKSYTCYSGLTATSIRLQLSKSSVYSWRVCAVDSKGNSTSWVQGKSFRSTLPASKSSALATASAGLSSDLGAGTCTRSAAGFAAASCSLSTEGLWQEGGSVQKGMLAGLG